MFFFGSYQGLRQINGVGTSGFAFGYSPQTTLASVERLRGLRQRHLHRPSLHEQHASVQSLFGQRVRGLSSFGSMFGGELGWRYRAVRRSHVNDGSNINNTAISVSSGEGHRQGAIQ